METLARDPGTTQTGKFIVRELGHLTEDDLVEVTLYLARALTARLRITSVTYRSGGALDIKRVFTQERAGPPALSIIRRLRDRGGTL